MVGCSRCILVVQSGFYGRCNCRSIQAEVERPIEAHDSFSSRRLARTIHHRTRLIFPSQDCAAVHICSPPPPLAAASGGGSARRRGRGNRDTHHACSRHHRRLQRPEEGPHRRMAMEATDGERGSPRCRAAEAGPDAVARKRVPLPPRYRRFACRSRGCCARGGVVPGRWAPRQCDPASLPTCHSTTNEVETTDV